MRPTPGTRTLPAPLLVLAAVLGAAACAPRRGGEAVGPDPRDVGVLAHPSAEAIPLYTSHRVPGCRSRVVGELSAGSLLGLREGAYQKLADAVVGVRRHVEPVPPAHAAGGSGTLRPATTEHYTGLAVSLEGACPGAAPPEVP